MQISAILAGFRSHLESLPHSVICRMYALDHQATDIQDTQTIYLSFEGPDTPTRDEMIERLVDRLQRKLDMQEDSN